MDIAHFRAPYKNSMLGFGADVTTPVAALTDMDPSTFVLSFKPTVASGILAMIGDSVVIIQGGDDTVSIVPALPGDPRETAAAWIKRKTAEGKEVAAGSTQGIPGVVMPLPPEAGLQKFLKAGGVAAIVQVAATRAAGSGGADPLFAVLTRPSGAPGLSSQASMGTPSSGKTLAVVAIAGIVGVGLYYVFRKPARGAS